MFEASFPVIAAWTNAAILTAAGLANLTGLRPLREIYADWDIPAGSYRTIGILQVVAAVFLATPDLRLWGVLLAATIMFGSVVFLLDHQRYAYAAPVVLLMATLVAATLAVPPVHASYAAAIHSHSIAAAVAYHAGATGDTHA